MVPPNRWDNRPQQYHNHPHSLLSFIAITVSLLRHKHYLHLKFFQRCYIQIESLRVNHNRTKENINLYVVEENIVGIAEYNTPNEYKLLSMKKYLIQASFSRVSVMLLLSYLHER